MEPLARVQEIADAVLAQCERVMAPVDGGGCFSCGRRATDRISMQLDGAEMFWALACPAHRDEPLSVDVTDW